MSLDRPPRDAFAHTTSGTADLKAEAVVLHNGPQIAIERDASGVVHLGPPPKGLSFTDVLAVFESLSNHNAEEVLITLDRGVWSEYAPELLKRGVAAAIDKDTNDQQLGVFPELLWQVPDLWLTDCTPGFPQTMQAGPHGRFPLRPTKPVGALYHRYIPWLSQVFSLRMLDVDLDLDLFHTWMNDTRVASFFDEAGSLDEHAAYLARMAADPHMMPVIGSLDGRAFCYFELYWAKENRIGAHYAAGDWDRGWHVLVGDEATRGVDYITTWLPSLMHYMFLTESRTQKLVGEPAADHTQQLRNLTRSGFARIKDFDFPHKRATLVSLERDYFFKGRLWARPDPKNPGAPLRLSLSAQTQGGIAK